MLLFDFELSACLPSLHGCGGVCVLWTKAENGPNNIIKFNALIFHGLTNAHTHTLALVLENGSRKPRAGQIHKSTGQLYRFIFKRTAKMIEMFLQSNKKRICICGNKSACHFLFKTAIQYSGGAFTHSFSISPYLLRAHGGIYIFGWHFYLFLAQR